MIFVDSNIPMYLVGAEHPHKHDAARLVERALARRERLVTDAEVLQEIPHPLRRHSTTGCGSAGIRHVAPSRGRRRGCLRWHSPSAKEILLGRSVTSARDAIHLAAMAEVGATRIMSFDRGFDHYPGVERLA